MTALVDSHVHFYDCFDAAAFLDAAAESFGRAARQLGLEAETPGCLMMSETPQMHFFRQLRDSSDVSSWSVEHTANAEAVRLRRDDMTLVVIAGRQIATTERLEVLALGCDAEFPKAYSFTEALDATHRAGAVAVVPWGFGKWSGRRGKLVRDVIDAASPGELFLGDNSGRLAMSRRPALFARGEARGLAVLPGSDPLPLNTEGSKAGRYGLVLPVDLDHDRPLDFIVAAIRSLRPPVMTFGRLERVASFCRCQLAMQLRRLGRS
jgi:hypothetical protein